MIGEFNIQLITNYHQIRWKQACSTSIMLFQEETRLLKPKSGGNKLAQHQLCYSKRKQGCSSPNQVETKLLNINYAFRRWNKVAQGQIMWKQGCSSQHHVEKRMLNITCAFPRWNKVAQGKIIINLLIKNISKGLIQFYLWYSEAQIRVLF